MGAGDGTRSTDRLAAESMQRERETAEKILVRRHTTAEGSGGLTRFNST